MCPILKRSDGKELTAKEYNVRLKATEKQIISGKSVSRMNLNEKWKNGIFFIKKMNAMV